MKTINAEPSRIRTGDAPVSLRSTQLAANTAR